MSWFAGLYAFGKAELLPETIKKIAVALSPAEPAENEFFIEKPLAFAQSAPCTTPDSLKEPMPPMDKGGRFVIVGDLRIDNREELISAFEIQRPHDRIPDSSLVLEAYRRWQDRCPERLLGDFAFALWDKMEQTLFCVRDRMGVRPFYYSLQNNLLAFSSAISPFFELPEISKKPHMASMEDYLTCGYIRSHERTFFEGIYRLPPACSLTFKDGKRDIRDYWPLSHLKENKRSLQENAEQLLALLSDAVKARLRAAQPAGFTVSGGLDSPSVFTAAYKNKGEQRFHAYSYTFGDLESDEKTRIERIIAGKDIHHTLIHALKNDFTEKYSFEAYYRKMKDWPMMSNALLRLILGDKAREEGVKILLTGEGGDETVQGNLGHITDAAKHCRFFKVLGEIGHYGSPMLFGKAVLSPLLFDSLKALKGNLNKNRKDEKYKYSDDVQEIHSYAMKRNIHGIRNFDVIMRMDAGYSQFTAHSGIEFRHPFMDSRLIEFVFTIPGEQKVHHGMTKRILRESMRGLLPEEVRTRKDKATLTSFVRHIAKNLDLNYYFKDMELVNIGLIDKRRLEYLLTNRNPDSAAWVSEVHQYINLELWYRANFLESAYSSDR